LHVEGVKYSSNCCPQNECVTCMSTYAFSTKSSHFLQFLLNQTKSLCCVHAITTVIWKRLTLYLVLAEVQMPLFCNAIILHQDAHHNVFFFFLRHVDKSYFNILIEPRPNPGLI